MDVVVDSQGKFPARGVDPRLKLTSQYFIFVGVALSPQTSRRNKAKTTLDHNKYKQQQERVRDFMSSDKAFSKRECVFSTVLATEILNKDTDMKKYLNLH